jgi:CubicO group peptidase (beta-lactamase class C family)/peptidoglycan/xylan/chitin deacetylase (PgdA/CDA1 family)
MPCNERIRRGLLLLAALSPSLALAASSAAQTSASTPPSTSTSTSNGDPLQLALTFDDLPWVGALPKGDTANDAVLRMAATLRAHQAPATGFVVCDRALQDDQPLTTWAAWGFSLGNHSAAHRDLNRTAVESWLDDVERCDRFLERYGSAKRPYFRFPLLHEGDTAEKRDRARDGLRRIGLATAHVTVDTSDWILQRVQAAALATGDAALRRDAGRELVRHVLAAVEHADAVARRKAGRRVPQVLLLHASTLVEDHLDALLLALRARDVELVSLEQALTDPAYARPDGYVGGKGLSWLYRMEPTSFADVAWDDAEAAAIEERFAVWLDDGLDGEPDDESGPAAGNPVSYRRLSSTTDRAQRELDAILTEAGSSERMRSLLVQHRGELLAEAYYHGAGPETAANLKSISKTLSSALVGIALRKGWIASLDDPLDRYLPELFQPGASREGKASITLRQLLTMSTGLAPVDYGTVQQSANWVATVLGRPLDEASRGRTFAYDTPVLQLLSAVLEAASGETVGEIAQRELLGPMGAELVYWRTDSQEIALGGNDAYLRPRDLLRLGELYRRGGGLDGLRLLPPDFVTDSTTPQIVPGSRTINHGTLPVRGYGFLWWLLDLGEEEAYAALGHGGQILLIAPREELVVVMTSRWPGPSSVEHYRHLTRILVDRLLPLFGSG